MQNPNHIFALDIGTRTVVGLILEEKNQKFEIIDMLSIEHEERSMLDGQIHDVLSVSKVIKKIKDALEEKHGPLQQVSVAAAGRALKTKRSNISIDIKGKPLINDYDILHLELSAVQKAQMHLANEEEANNSAHYYCVGYSVLHYLLDDEEIGNLLDQQGDKASVEVIATFLPKVVVESLIAALERAGLEMGALTLEPIAAINVLIPPSMRRLNVALIDIGAGTSDIAITDMGTIVAYGMVPIAGDEITEAISDQFLLDFPFAEKAKRELHTNNEIIIQDILGFETTIQKADIIDKIKEPLDRLASAIANELLLLNNNKAPKAIMLVGGGSLTPELPKLLSTKLELPDNRIAIRGIDAIQKLELTEDIKQSPELVTPIGIAIAAKQNPVHYITVIVNNKTVRLFDMKKLTVGDCLLSAGIEMTKLYGKPGMAKIVDLNGREITIPGLHGEQPTLLLNGEPTKLDTQIEDGSRIDVKKGKDGGTQEILIGDLIEEQPVKQIWINEVPQNLSFEIYQNGKLVNMNSPINDRDKIVTYYPKTIREVLERTKEQSVIQNEFYIYLNQSKILMPNFSTTFFKNNIEVKMDSKVNSGDRITMIMKKNPTIYDLFNQENLSLYYQIPITFNGERLSIKKLALDVYINNEGPIHDQDKPLHIGDKVKAVDKKVTPFIFQDVFRFVDVEFPATQNGQFILLRNGNQVRFDDQLTPGDELAIEWTNNN